MEDLDPSGVVTPVRHICPLTSKAHSEAIYTDWRLMWIHSTIIVLFLVDLLFDVSSSLPAYRCDGSMLAGLALPCARRLWRATTSAEWKKEYTVRGDGGTGRQLTYGDLLNSRCKPDRALDSWLSQLDDFGTLVMAAASLP